jgi:hypothetical protein
MKKNSPENKIGKQESTIGKLLKWSDEKEDKQEKCSLISLISLISPISPSPYYVSN